ncbi:MAG: DNA polymerase III subunit beta [Tannerellaceae bacterium]|jgi:DNA polymerase-3 subunit beta|nr:DNA polymerase III subunit beta [Tannerellaceae bacterium]
MNFSVSSTALLSRLQSISKVIASKNTLPVLECFLFRLEGDILVLTASDGDVRITTSVNVINPEGEGTIAISSKSLLDPIKELPEQPVTFNIDNESKGISIHFQGGKYDLVGEDGDAYPIKPELGENSSTLSLDGQVLLSGISRSLFATAEDELRPVMNGIYFDFLPEGLTFVASDGHKLVRLCNTTVRSENHGAFTFPKKAANLLRNLLIREVEPVSVTFDDDKAIVTGQGFELACRLIEGRYPNYNSVIPKNNPHKITINRLALTSALKRASSFTNPSTYLVKLQFKDNELLIVGQDIDFARRAEERIPCQYGGDELNIGFKSTFLIEILTNIYAEDVIFELADPSRAALVLPAENGEDENLLMLIMPMMLND